jgi:hypothetical protein
VSKCQLQDVMPQPPPACEVAYGYVTQEVCSTVGDASGAVRSLVQCGTTAGHMSSGSEPEVLKQAADLRFLSWGGQDLNLRPTDYEFDSDAAATCVADRGRASDQRFLSALVRRSSGRFPVHRGADAGQIVANSARSAGP